MKAQKQFYLSLGIVIAMFVAWVVSIYLPTSKRIALAQKQTHNYTARIDSAFSANKNLDLLNTKLSNAQLEKYRLQQRFIKPDDFRSLASRLKKLFAVNDLQLIEFTPHLGYFLEVQNDSKNPVGLQRLPIRIQLKGQFFNLSNLLEDLHRRQLAIMPEGIVIKKPGKYSDDVTITMNISVFVNNRS